MQPKTDARIDAYIEKSAPFAKPVLQHIRALVHQACPDAAETIKWGMPFFEYKGIICNMAAFKNHCSLGFFKAGQMKSSAELQAHNEEGMGHLGKITSLQDLPSDEVLIGYIKEAAALNESGIKKTSSRKTMENKELTIPEEVTRALEMNIAAKSTFNNFAYSHKKEYVEWITGAKKEETRLARLEKTIEKLTNGKKNPSEK